MNTHEVPKHDATEDLPDAAGKHPTAGQFLELAVDHHAKLWEAAERRGDTPVFRLHRGLMTAYHFVQQGIERAGLAGSSLNASQRRMIYQAVNASVEPVTGDVPVGENVARIDETRLRTVVHSLSTAESKEKVAGAAKATEDEVEKVLGA